MNVNSPPRRFAPHSNVVAVLRDYPNAPIDFVAGVLGESRERVEALLAPLERDGIVRRFGNDAIALTDGRGQAEGQRTTRAGG